MSRDMENSLKDLLENVQDHIDSTNSQVFVYTGKRKMQIINEFAILFVTAFLQCIDDYNLTRNDIRVMLKIIEYMKFGNLLRMSYSSIAKDLNIDKSNVSKTIKKLKENKLIITINGSDYLNPHVIAKGSFIDEGGEMLLNQAADELEGSNITPSILTPHLRKKSKQINFDITKKRTELLTDD